MKETEQGAIGETNAACTIKGMLFKLGSGDPVNLRQQINEIEGLA